MVLIPEGEFTMGSDIGHDDEKPVHTAYLDAFYIDRHEVTNAQYGACVDAGVCDPPGSAVSYSGNLYYYTSLYDNYPVVHVSWYDAQTYCTWAGKKLPTEAQWEKAARGTDGRIYPWGNEWDGDRLNYCDANCPFNYKDTNSDDEFEDKAPVGSYSPEGDSPYGVSDMAGNVWEWVADWYDADYYGAGEARNPQGPASGEYKVLHGSSWDTTRDNVRCAYRYRYNPDYEADNVGFRCAKSSA